MLPRVILYNGVSLDGRIESFALDIAKFYELAGRWGEEAILSGADTVLEAPAEIPPEDETAFAPRQSDPADRRPLLAIVDSRGRVRGWHFWCRQPYWRDAVAIVSHSTPRDYLSHLRERHVEYIVAGEDKVDLRRALEELNERYGVNTVRVDSGGALNGALLRARLVAEVSLLVSPVLVGGPSARSFFKADDPASPADLVQLRLAEVERLEGDNLWMRYEVVA